MYYIRKMSDKGVRDRSSRAVRRWVRNQGTVLLNQQIWCWGQDIRHREGNLLLAYGFHRHRPPANTHGSSCYELLVSEQTSIRLWGFGLLYEHLALGGIFLKRYAFVPTWTPLTSQPSTIWSSDQLPFLTRPRSRGASRRAHCLLLAALRWIINYERWVRMKVGEAYRSRCIEDFPHSEIPAISMIPSWGNLTRHYALRKDI